MVTNVVILTLFDIGSLEDTALFIQSYISNFSIAAIYMVSYFYLHIAFSGVPLISDTHILSLYQLKLASLVWGIGRLSAGVSDLLFSLYFDREIYIVFINIGAENLSLI